MTTISSTSGGLPPGWVDPIATYGAVGNGSTDDTTALQSAITAAKTNGGAVYLDPTKTFLVTAALVLDNNTKGFRLTGGGSGNHSNVGMPTIKFTGTGAGSVLQCHSIFGVEIDHLRIQYTSSSFTGDLIDIDGNPNAADCISWHVHHVSTSGAPTTARSAVRLNKAIIGRIDNCGFNGAVNQVRVGDPGGSYVVGVTLESNTYNNSSDAHILLGSGDAEAITIRNEVFEAGTSTPGIKGSSCQLYTPLIEGCWFGDSGAATTWITGLTTAGNNSFGTIRNNYFADCNGGTHIGGTSTGAWLIEGNEFTGGTAFDFSPGGCQLSVNSNDFANCTIFAGTRPTAIEAHNNVSTSATETKILRDVMRARVAIGQKNGGPTTLEPGPTDSTEQLVLASSTATALAALGEKAGLYTYYSGGNLFAVVLQAPTFATAREVQIATGTTPVPVFRAADAKLAFYNTAPISKPAVTGSRGGNAALASLLTQLAALGLITDSSSA